MALVISTAVVLGSAQSALPYVLGSSALVLPVRGVPDASGNPIRLIRL